jgi:hypothetical protein
MKELKLNKHEENNFTQEYKTQFFMVSIIRVFLTIYNLIYIYELPTIPNRWKILVEYTNFSYIQEFVNSSIIKVFEFNNDVTNFIKERDWEKRNSKDPLTILKTSYYILKSEKELEEKYEDMKNQINNYIPKQIPDLLILISKLENNNLIKNNSLKEAIDIINIKINSIEKSTIENENFNFELYFSDKKLPKAHKEIIDEKIKEWNKIIKNKKTESLSEVIVNFFVTKNMKGLNKYIDEHFSDFLNQKSLLGNIDFKIIETFLNAASSKQYQNFRGAVYQCYKYDNFIKNPNEKTTIKKIIEWCENNLDENQDKIILMQRRWLIENFEKLID